MTVIERTKDGIKDEMLTLDKPVSADFWVAWRELCRMMMPVLDGLARELSNQSKAGQAQDTEQQEWAVELCEPEDESIAASVTHAEAVILNILEE